MNNELKILSLFLLFSLSVSSQTSGKKKSSPLTYYYIGEGCPVCLDKHPEKKFGFIIKCIGCISSDTAEANNHFVTTVLDKKYGNGWTFKYIYNYCDEAGK